MTDTAALQAHNLTLAYDARLVASGLDVAIPEGEITVIVGPNACGKSTLLRTLSRLLTPSTGRVLLGGEDLRTFGAKPLARKLGLLPQTSTAPFGITVADLVGRGRFPHQRMLQQWSRDDEAAVNRALAATGIIDLADRSVDELSGGQRQRVWIALLLAQDTQVMLLDEPTTFLDIAHQLEVLELCERLNREEGRTLVLVLHDLNQAARFADHLIVLRDGALEGAGAPADILTADLLERVFGLRAEVHPDPVFGTPMVIPLASIQTTKDES